MTQPTQDLFDNAYKGEAEELGLGTKPPWSIGEPQPELAALIEQGKFHGDVLDVGCGEAAIALYLAERGFTTVGLDLSPTAIELARQGGRQAGPDQRQPSTSPTSARSPDTTAGSAPSLTQRFSTPFPWRPVRDTSSRSCAPPRRALRTTRWCSIAPACPTALPTLSPSDELRDVVAKYWVIDEIRPARIHANFPEAAEGVGMVFGDVRDEANGRKSVPAWLLSAHLPAS